MRMESSQIARYWSKTSLKYLVEHRQGGIRLGVSDVSQANSLSILFFVYFKENIDYWIGLLGGLAPNPECAAPQVNIQQNYFYFDCIFWDILDIVRIKSLEFLESVSAVLKQ